ncbi:MAG: tetratricopeptide repeat protein [Gammaproteobacteria bacterium]|nr:tetratricopeptide repeat protein [Gammaproteobacteria bacterium]
MYYIKLLLISALLTACSTTNNTSSITSSGLSPLEQSESELSRYKTAITLLNNNKLDDAKNIFVEFKYERPELAGPYANLAVIALKRNNPDEAIKLVKIAVEKNPKSSQALNLLAYLEQMKGEITSALNHYKQAIQNNNNYAIAHYNIALLYDVYMQDVENAIPHYERYMKLTNNKDKNTADWLEQIKRTRENG